MANFKIQNRPSHHEIVSSKQFWRIAYLETSKAQGSNRAAQPLNALRALPLYPVFEDEKLKGSDKKSLKTFVKVFNQLS